MFLEGDKVSTRQFANAVGESKDNIANYENGRANVPNRLLLALYHRGFNPVYIITGEGDIFADNKQGRALKHLIKTKKEIHSGKAIAKEYDYSKLSVQELERRYAHYQVAAGDIRKIIEKKKKSDK